MKTLVILQKTPVEKGTLVKYEIKENNQSTLGERLVPRGYDRLIIPFTDSPALSAYL